MKIGLISDTHGHIDDLIVRCFEDCDEIWHAGDFGSMEVADRLADSKPLRGVYGNIDAVDIRERFPEDLRFECEGVDCIVTHIAGRPGRYVPRIRQLLQSCPPQLLLCGHSHIVETQSDPKFGVRYINPGAAGHQGFHTVRTLLKIELSDGQIGPVRLLELGPRGKKRRNSE